MHSLAEGDASSVWRRKVGGTSVKEEYGWGGADVKEWKRQKGSKEARGDRMRRVVAAAVGWRGWRGFVRLAAVLDDVIGSLSSLGPEVHDKSKAEGLSQRLTVPPRFERVGLRDYAPRVAR
jgi:hypothetical protein